MQPAVTLALDSMRQHCAAKSSSWEHSTSGGQQARLLSKEP